MRCAMAARLLLVCIGAWVLPGTLGFAVPSPSYVLQKKGVATTPDPCRAPIAAPRRRELAGACVRMSADTSTKTEKKKGVGGFDEEKITVERYKLFPRGDMAKLDLDMPSYEGKEALYELYHNADKLVVVQFSKKLCSMCRVIKPPVDKVMKEFSGRIHFVDCEVTANKDIIPQVTRCGARSVRQLRAPVPPGLPSLEKPAAPARRATGSRCGGALRGG